MALSRQSIITFIRGIRYDDYKAQKGARRREIAKTVLEIFRNIGVIAGLQYVALKTGSMPIKLTAEAGNIALAVFIGSYFTQYRSIAFENDYADHDYIAFDLITSAITAVSAILMYLFLSFGIRCVVSQIVASQGLT